MLDCIINQLHFVSSSPYSCPNIPCCCCFFQIFFQVYCSLLSSAQWVCNYVKSLSIANGQISRLNMLNDSLIFPHKNLRNRFRQTEQIQGCRDFPKFCKIISPRQCPILMQMRPKEKAKWLFFSETLQTVEKYTQTSFDRYLSVEK